MISVVVPVYNVYPFLKECIDSICGQTYTDLEIILVDDGSTDKSGILCDTYAQKDSRIKTVHQKNQGLSAARNTGIQLAEGEYIVLVDSDDRIHPQMIQALYDAIQQNDAELAICSHRTIHEMESEELLLQEIRIETQKIEIISGRECAKRMYSSNSNIKQKIDMTVAWNKLYRKSMFYYLQYPVGRLEEDEFLTYKILYPLEKCIFLNLPLYEYRVRSGSITSNKNIKRLKDRLKSYEEKCDYFKQKGDMELYYMTLRIYETSIAETILFLKENQMEPQLLCELNNRFKVVYKEKIADSKIPFQHKLKFILFMKNKTIYKILKRLVSKNENNVK